jgi:sugar lactone lactonase YvrE
VVDSKHGEIKVLNQDGKFLFRFGKNGDGEGQFNLPEGITLDREDNVYVCDAMNGRIQKFDSRGNFLGLFNEGLKRPTSICIDSENNFYVVDAELKQVIKFEWTV